MVLAGWKIIVVIEFFLEILGGHTLEAVAMAMMAVVIFLMELLLFDLMRRPCCRLPRLDFQILVRREEAFRG